eukprot:1160858-Pelagomonas_calceolata.AAC.12
MARRPDKTFPSVGLVGLVSQMARRPDKTFPSVGLVGLASQMARRPDKTFPSVGLVGLNYSINNLLQEQLCLQQVLLVPAQLMCASLHLMRAFGTTRSLCVGVSKKTDNYLLSHMKALSVIEI